MKETDRKLIQGCGALLEEWRDVVGPSDPAIRVMERIRAGSPLSEEDAAQMRASVMRLAELSQTLPPLGHPGIDRKGQLDALLRSVPAGWFQEEQREGRELWLVHGMAPLGIADLKWVYLETCRGELLSEDPPSAG